MGDSANSDHWRHPTGAANMNNHYGNGQELSMARSNPVVNGPWPYQPARPSERFTDLRKKVLKVVTFVRLWDADEITMHDKRAVMETNKIIG